MTSFEFTRNALRSFLTRRTPGILALKGNWGVGKTYVWRQTIEDLPAQPGKTFAYVSLFGITSIAELKRTIVARRAPLPQAKSIRSWFGQKTAQTAGLLPYVDLHVVKNTELLADAIADRVLRDGIVCLDDLERKEAGLSEQALLGFITSLREERNCTVVLLYNEEEVTKQAPLAKTLAEYREKVIDAEVTLRPTPAECFELVFGPNPPELPRPVSFGVLFAAEVRSPKEIFAAHGVANIRVLRRTKETLAFFATELEKQYPLMWPAFARQVVKLCILHFVHGREFTLAEVVGKDQWVAIHLERRKQKDQQPVTDRFKSIFDLDYHPHETDSLIVDYLVTGYVDFAGQKSLLEQIEKNQQLTALGAEHRKIWDQLWDNFQVSQEDFVTRQLDFVRANFDKLGLSEVAQVEMVLADLGDYPEIRELLDRKIKVFAELTRDVDQLGMALTSVPKHAAERVQQLRAAQAPTPKPMPEVLANMTQRGGWNSSDMRFLASYSEDDFFQWLSTETQPDLLGKLKILRQRTGSDPTTAAVMVKLDAALGRLAARSKIDAFRVHNGANLPKPEPPAQPSA